jgi:hypothetical protein
MPPKTPRPRGQICESYPQDIFFLHTHGIDKNVVQAHTTPKNKPTPRKKEENDKSDSGMNDECWWVMNNVRYTSPLRGTSCNS